MGSTAGSARARNTGAYRSSAALALAVFSILILQASAYTSQATVVGSVNVTGCPFGITLSAAQPIFVQPANIVISYSVNTLVPASTCSGIPSLSGTLIVENSSSGAHYGVNSITLTDITNVPTTGNIMLNSTLTYEGQPFPASTDIATLSLSYSGTSNSATTGSFDVASPANVQINNFAPAASPITQGSSINLNSNLTNAGSLSGVNATLSLWVTGPGNTVYSTNVAVGTVPASGGGPIFESITVPGSFSGAVGTYSAIENVSYYSTYSVGNTVYTTNILYSANAMAAYTVQSQGGGGGCGGCSGPPAPKPAPLPSTPSGIGQVAFYQLPLLTSIATGNSTLASLGLRNSGSSSIWVNMTVPQVAFGTITLSSKSVYLLPSQTLPLSVFVTTNPNATAGTYFVPINMSISQAGQSTQKPTIGQTYILVKVAPYSSTEPTVTQTSVLSNNSKNLTTTLQVYNPTNKTVYDATVTITLPSTSIQNSSDLIAGGDPPVTTFSNNTYKITWEIPQILPKSTSVLFYSINNVQNPQVVSDIPATFSSATQASQNASFKVINIGAPIAYVNGSADITVTALYTGSNSSEVTIVLTGPTGVRIDQPTQVIRVVPNGAISATFTAGPMASTGTQSFHISIYGDFPNQTYSVPVSVLPQQAAYAPTQTTQITEAGIFKTPVFYTAVIVAVVAVFCLAFFGRQIYKNLNKARYNQARAQKLVRISERIGRETKSDDEDE